MKQCFLDAHLFLRRSEKIFEEKLTAEKFDMLQRYMADGGDVTLRAMQGLSRDEQQDILEYLRDCPLYETLRIDERAFILVHSGLGDFSPKRHIEGLQHGRPAVDAAGAYRRILQKYPHCARTHTDVFFLRSI